ncbi:Retrovirus-related Pol polyprotein from transposon TNT 1-94 [Lucilia cuprina]|nr:Retrovirus-related Pol polyprotein from transposon TNT 1-94 [Lucilia cuprina]
MSSTVSNIDKLDGENYATWNIQVKSLLITMDLWQTIEEECPQDKPGKWISTDSKALATIYNLTVKPCQLVYIKNCLTAKEAWNVLSSMYRADTASRKVNLFKKLVRFKFNLNEKFATQVNEFVSTIDGLKEIGIILNDDLLSILLLCSLPEEMEGFVVAMESRDRLPKYDKLIAKILEEEMRQNNKVNEGPNETVFAANSRKEYKRNKKMFNSKRHDVKYPQHKANHQNEKRNTDVNKIIKSGNVIEFAVDKAIVKSKQNQNILTAGLVDDMFVVNLEKVMNFEMVNGIINENVVKKWHQRFGHININDLNKLSSKNMVKGLDVKMPKSIECLTCAVNKIAATPYKNYSSVQTSGVLELVHTDLCGPIGVRSVGGSSYFITFIDDYSRYISTYFLKQKSDAMMHSPHFLGSRRSRLAAKIKLS